MRNRKLRYFVGLAVYTLFSGWVLVFMTFGLPYGGMRPELGIVFALVLSVGTLLLLKSPKADAVLLGLAGVFFSVLMVWLSYPITIVVGTALAFVCPGWVWSARSGDQERSPPPSSQ